MKSFYPGKSFLEAQRKAIDSLTDVDGAPEVDALARLVGQPLLADPGRLLHPRRLRLGLVTFGTAAAAALRGADLRSRIDFLGIWMLLPREIANHDVIVAHIGQ